MTPIIPTKIPRNRRPNIIFSFLGMLSIKTIVPEYNIRTPPNNSPSFVFHVSRQKMISSKPIAIRKKQTAILFIYTLYVLLKIIGCGIPYNGQGLPIVGDFIFVRLKLLPGCVIKLSIKN